MNGQNYWKQIWEEKGQLETNNLKELDGFEATLIDPEEVVTELIKILDIKESDKVLEVGCGAGMLAQYLAQKCKYQGIDRSKSLLEKHKKLLGNDVRFAEAKNLPFDDNEFDKIFSYSVFHYFPDKNYVKQVIGEMKRVCTGRIFIGDLPITSSRKEHLLFNKNEIVGEISDGFYDKERFNVLI